MKSSQLKLGFSEGDFNAYEINVHYKPIGRVDELDKIISTVPLVKFLRSIWNEDFYSKESVYIVLLNQSMRIIGYKQIATGTVRSCSVDSVDIVRLAIVTNASAVIIAHNHPSGNLEASDPDIAMSQRLYKQLDLFSISLADSIILTPDGYSSISY